MTQDQASVTRFRVGGKVPLNVYDRDRPVFQCHTPEEAHLYVSLLNAGASHEQVFRQLQADKERLIEQLALKTGCAKCKGIGFKEVHRRGFTHYETDAGEECPPYHYERVPCSHCSDAARGVQLAKEATDAVA